MRPPRLAGLVLVAGAAAAAAMGVAAQAALAHAQAQQVRQPDSPWYQDRGTEPRPLPAGDSKLETALMLSTLLRNGQVPGFYDGQFALVKERFDDLAAIARDADLNHVLRVMAVMALQEASDGERLRAVLEPLIGSPDWEYHVEWQEMTRPGPELDNEDVIREVLAADLSRHARFSLAKDGQPGPVLAKIREMEAYVNGRLATLLDPSLRMEDFRDGVYEGRMTMFSIGYHYQQFDDFAHAAEWFQRLCDHLPGHRETQMAHYNLGCIEALAGRPEAAMRHLEGAYAVGFSNVAWLEEDGDLTSLRERSDFRALVAAMRNQAPEPPEPAVEPGER